MRRVLSTLGGLALLSYADFGVEAQSLQQTYVNFTTDPSWISANSRTAPQNYGWSNTDNTGNSVNTPDHTATGAGEIGGTMTRSSSPPNFYGVNIGTMDLHSDSFTVSGVVRIVTRGGSSGWFLGYSQGVTSYGPGSGSGPKNFIGLNADDGWDLWGHIWDRNGSRDRFDITTNLTDPQTQPNHIGTEVVPFKFSYSPTGGSSNEGFMSFSINNTANQIWNLSGSQKSGLDTLTSFGIFPQSANGGNLEVYFDDLDFTYRNVPPPPPTPAVWNVPSGGSWFTGTNWDGLVPPNNAADSEADFLGAISAPQTVFADDAVTVGKLKFDNANTYNITGAGSITLASSGTASVQVLSGTHKLNIPVFVNSNTDVTVSAGATLKISDPVTVAAGKTITQSGNIVFESTVTLLPASAIALGATLSGGQTLSVNNLNMASDAKIDVSNNAMLIASSSAASMTESVRSAFNGGAWNGNGITSSAAAADVSHRTGVGIADSESGVLLKYTYYGDANLNGTVDSADFAALATHFNGSGLWNQGDFNYDGVVNALDFGALASNFGQAGAGSLGAAALGSLVPEPGVLALATTGLLLFGRRLRWRK